MGVYMGQAVAVATATVVPVFLTGGLAVQISRDLDFAIERIGLAPAAFFGAAAICSPVAGVVTEWLGPGRSMRIAVATVATVLLVVAAVANSLPVLLGLLAVAGAGNALAQPSTNLFLAQRVPRRRQGVAYGVKQSAIPTAGLLAGLAVPVLGVTVGWRWAFVAMAIVGVIVAVASPTAGPSQRTTRQGRREAGDIGRPTLVVMATAAGVAAASGSALGVYLVAGAVDAGWSESSGGLIFALASLVGICARLLSGFRADRRGRGHVGVIVAMLVAGTVGFALLAPGAHLLFALGAPIAFGFGWGWPGLFILAVVQANPSSPASATGLTQTGTSIGSVVGPALFGFVAAHSSFTQAWLVAGGGLLLSAGSFVLLRHYVAALRDAGDVAGNDQRAVIKPTASTAQEGSLSMDDRTLVESYFAACSTGNADEVAGHFDDDAVVYDTNHPPVRGAAQIGRFYAAAARRWGGASWHVDTFVADGSGHCASEWTMEAPAAGALVRGSEHYRTEHGRITEIRQYWTFDPDDLATQLQDYPYTADDRWWTTVPQKEGTP